MDTDRILSELLNAYANYLLAAGLASGTITVYISNLRAFRRDLRAVTLAELEAFLADLKRHGRRPETIKSFRTSFRSFYQWAYKRGVVAADPTIDLRGVHIPKTVARLAPDDAVQYGLLTAPLDEQQMILAGRMGCLRLSEITNLHMRDRHGDIFRVCGKGGKTRNVPINDTWMGVVLELERTMPHGYYLAGRFGGAVHPSTVSKKIHGRTGYNPHALRHAGATAAFEATHDIRALQELLGHESLATTERYLHTSLEAIRRAANGTEFKSTVVNPHAVGRLWDPFKELSAA